MYTSNKRDLVKAWGNWLGEKSWDYFTTITYKHNINAKRNESIMLKLEDTLKDKLKSFKMFWIMEYTSNGYQTHNHLLIEGEGIKREINNYLLNHSLINKKYIKHIPYNKDLGATYYVSKHITSKQVNYGIKYSENNNL